MREAEIRRMLIQYLSQKKNQVLPQFINELFVDRFRRRVDVVKVDQHLSAYEIKSDQDKIVRLPGQIETFKNYFEYVSVVTTQVHLNAVLGLLDGIGQATVGVMLADQKKGVKTIRRAKINRLDVFHWLAHLPVDELRLLAKSKSVRRGKDRAEAIQNISRHVLLTDVRKYVLEYFRRRDAKFAERYQGKVKIPSKNERMPLSLKDILEERRARLRASAV